MKTVKSMPDSTTLCQMEQGMLAPYPKPRFAETVQSDFESDDGDPEVLNMSCSAPLRVGLEHEGPPAFEPPPPPQKGLKRVQSCPILEQGRGAGRGLERSSNPVCTGNIR